jgi:hypothetical protein
MVQCNGGCSPICSTAQDLCNLQPTEEERLGLTIKPHVVLHILLCDEGVYVLLGLMTLCCHVLRLILLLDFPGFHVCNLIWAGSNACVTSLESS